MFRVPSSSKPSNTRAKTVFESPSSTTTTMTTSTTVGPKTSSSLSSSEMRVKRSTSTGSTSTGSGSNPSSSMLAASTVGPAVLAETNFSNEEIDNVCVNIEESAACSSSQADNVDKTNEKNIYYNDMKAAANATEKGFYNEDDPSYLEEDGEIDPDRYLDEHEEDDLDEDENTHLNPLVRVKYNCDYDYDNQKFHLVEGETLFLINKSNQDWWLCLRLADKLTFFVPASYVKEIENPNSSMRLQPPPRPPPPPPPAPINRASTSRLSDVDIRVPSPKPQVKKRQQQNLMHSSRTNIETVQSVYENLADSGSGLSRLRTNDDTDYGLNPDAIISDLDDRLNREEESFVNRMENTANISSSAASELEKKRISAVFGVESKVLLPSASIDPDYDDQHIYQNFPFVDRSKAMPATDQRKSSASDRTSKINKLINELKMKEEASTKSESNEDDEDEDDDEEEEEDEDERESSEDQNSNSNDETGKTIYIPKGWRVELTKYKRKCFVSELNGDKWYLNYDANGNHYFYNANNESAWQLPQIYPQEDDETNNDANGGNGNNFYKIIDQDLPTFKNLYSRLSTSNTQGGAAPTSSMYLKSAQTGGGASSNSYLGLGSTEPSSNTSSSKHGAPTSYSSSSGVSSRLASATQTTTVSYSNKPPSDLNSNFKCIVLAKSGKKCRKKNSDNYKVSLVSTKLLFVKDSKTPKLEFFVDFKGGKCFKVETTAPKKSQVGESGKDSNNNVSKDKEKEKLAKEKEKERAELAELVGSNKSALIVETLTGYRILMISENDLLINDWVYAINSIITQIQSEFSPIYEGPELLHSTHIHEPESMKPKQLPTTSHMSSESNKKQQKNKDLDVDGLASASTAPKLPDKAPPPPAKKTTTTTDETAAVPDGLVNAKFSQIIKTLNAFLSRRPPIEQLKKEGIIKECVFGSNLVNLCKKEKRNVPSFVDEIIGWIESKGLEVDGLYRISGNLSEVQKVRYQVDHGKYNFKDFDIHVLCGALKTFFRELEDPLIPYGFHQFFINSTTIPDRSKRLHYVQELVKKLPLSHRETLRNLLRHLLKVIDLSSQNRMNLQNIALVFGPNIMRGNPLNDASTGFNPHIMTQNSIVEYLLTNYRELYSFQPNSIFTEYSEFA